VNGESKEAEESSLRSSMENTVTEPIKIDSPSPLSSSSDPSDPSPVTHPVAERDAVLSACFNTSLALTVMGAGGRLFSSAAFSSGWLGGIVPDLSLALPLGSSEPATLLLHIAEGMVVAGAVTAARLALLQAWPDFRKATDGSNRTVLSTLKGSDLLQISALPAVSEELLFRGLLLPIVGTDWKGIVIAGVVFGGLHIPGGRNPAFAIWASAVGCAYGVIAVQSNDLITPMIAHAFANYFSARYWQSKNLSTTNLK